VSDKPFRLTLAFGHAILIWIVGFIWGSVVFMVPQWKAIKAIPYISTNPAISVPILLVWLPLTYVLAHHFLQSSSTPAFDGLKLGLVFVGVDIILDLAILVIALGAGLGYFVALSVWTGYGLIFAIPPIIGRALQMRAHV